MSASTPRGHPSWTIEQTGHDPLRRRVSETLLTLAASGIGTRGALEETPPGSQPLVLAAGVYQGKGSAEHLLSGPIWTAVDVAPPPRADRQLLDLHDGVLIREETGGSEPLRTIRFASVARVGVVALRAQALDGRLRSSTPLRLPDSEFGVTGELEGRRWAKVSALGGITAVASQSHTREASGIGTLDRIAAYRADPYGTPDPVDVLPTLLQAESLGFEGLLHEHRAIWNRRWEMVNVSIPDDEAAELACRFALFHLWGNVSSASEAAVGARGLSGTGYSGHVFWDADVFVLPAIAAINPSAARAMIEYRIRRLPSARRAARAAGREGARFPWESASGGHDVTPALGDLGGMPIEIRTGDLEEHITADVAWSVWHYAHWADDKALLTGSGGELLIDTGRYWASRCRLDDNGRAHIDPVIGPDEYHESVADNAFTNVMARWNLRVAADLCSARDPDDRQARRWRDLASALVDGYHAGTGRYEQFSGFFDLESLRASDIAAPPFAADVLLGRRRMAGAQLIKQPDVLMLHHLVPDETEAHSLSPNLDYYGPRTSHGSSLSPAITAALLARAGRADEALPWLRTALRLDLDDLTGLTATGLHLATLGGVWQAILFGFVGARVRHDVLLLDPRLPSAWPQLEVRFQCLGRLLRVRITARHVEVAANRSLRVQLTGHPVRRIVETTRFDRRASV